MPVIEWNAHMFSRDTDRYPFHARAAYTPDPADLAADPLADYLARMESEGIDRAVLVHPESYGDDHRLVLDCLQREPDRFWGTCLYYPADPDAGSDHGEPDADSRAEEALVVLGGDGVGDLRRELLYRHEQSVEHDVFVSFYRVPVITRTTSRRLHISATGSRRLTRRISARAG